ncbi:MAG: hypothetical protein SH850_25245 [Planctomycetaceae bacterium]|nr:hypothetical protein [Planctomycetaceae bacterium]
MKFWHITGLSALLLSGVGWAAGWLPWSGRGESAATTALLAADRDATPDQAVPLIVHEWGTFTSFSGSDGVKLEFRPLEERDLPGFVFNRSRHSLPSLSKNSIPAIQRMETPVTYFYTPVERDVTVRVSFPQGLLTEFYPPVRSLGPKVEGNGFLFSPVVETTSPPLKDSWLDWGRVHLIPPESLQAKVEDAELSRRIGRHVEQTMLPDAGTYQHYAAARATDSAIVQVRHLPQTGPDANVVPTADYFEKFLFYRGLGNFELPLTLTANPDASCTLRNSGRDEIRSLFLVTVRGKELRFRQYPSIAAGATLDLQPSNQTATLDQLSDAVASALVAEGLYEKEARAMVSTWQTSWFGEEGTRLFYILPQSVTDTLLPLEITPKPTEQVRVLVGRMEIMTPTQEQEVLSLVQRSLTARGDVAKGVPSPLLPELLKLGRLGEPALVRARHLSTTDAVKHEAQRLMAELREERTKAVQ